MSVHLPKDLRKLASLALIPIFLVIIEIFVVLSIQTVFEPPYLLLITNTVFVGLIPLYIAYLSFQSYTAYGRPGVVMIGGGMLAMGIGSILAGMVRSLPDGANLNVTVYNTAFCLGAVFAFSAALANIFHPSWLSATKRTRNAVLMYTGVVIFILMLTGATLIGLTPPFFIQGVGPTMLRQGILIGAIVLLAASSVIFYLDSIRKREDFFFWMAISFGLIAIGLLAFAQELVVGGLVGWFGRAAEYVGATYALVAYLSVKKTASAQGIHFEEMLAQFFGEAEVGYRALVEASTNAIIVFDPYDRIIIWNAAAEQMFGYTRNEAVGSSISIIVPHKELASLLQGEGGYPDHGECDLCGRDHIETKARRKDGTTFPVDTSVFGHMVGTSWAKTCIIRDITERKQTEKELERQKEQLQESESILKSFFDAPGGMRGIVEVISGEDIRHIADNYETAAFIGLTPEAMKNRRGSELGEPADVLRTLITHYNESRETGKPVTFEYHDPRGTGEGWLSATVSYLGTPGEYPRFAYVVRDITEQKKTEQALQRKQAEIQVLFDNIPVGLVLFDATRPYSVLIHNRFYQELFAEPYRSKGMDGLNVYEYAPEAEAAGIVAAFDEVVLTRTPKVYLDFPYNSNPPDESWFNWYLAPLLVDGEVVALVSMSLEVTDQHRAEATLKRKMEELNRLNETLVSTQEELRYNYEALAKSGRVEHETRQYLENLITYANAPIIVWDPDFRITLFNHAFELLTGMPAGSVVGQHLDILFPNRYREEAMEIVRRTATGERLDIVEIPIVHISGDVRTVLWNSATLFQPDGKTVLSTIAQGQDITERKQAIEALKEYADNLKRSNEDLERFAYVASHDLREPLRMVTSFSQLLERNYKGRLDPDADEFIGYIVEGGRKMDALVNDLLEFSRVTSRGKPFKPADMNAVFGEVKKSLSIAITENNAKITTGPLPTITVDHSQMVLLFQNLIANAIKFHDNKTPLVFVDAVKKENEWVFSVRDNGIGIDPEYHEKIFELFQRLHTGDNYPGTGIGLAICKRIVERHGGRIWVESEPEKGSTFFFTIPDRK